MVPGGRPGWNEREHVENNGVLVLASVLLALLAPTPEPTNPFNLNPIPQASQYPLIGTSRTRALCSAMKKVVAPAVAAALTNDKTYAGFRKSLNDYTIYANVSSRDFKIMLMDRTVQSMVKSVDALETALNNHSFDAPPDATRRDAEALTAIRDSMRGVLGAQKVELDAMSGFVETERMRTFGQLSEGEQQMKSSLGTSPTQPPGANFGNDGLMNPNAQSSNVVNPNNATSYGFLNDSRNAFKTPTSSISLVQAHQLDSDLGDIAAFVSKREDVAAKIIIPATTLCK